MILRARKNGRGAFKLHAAMVMHAGDNHAQDGKDYVPAIDAVLRYGAALMF